MLTYAIIPSPIVTVPIDGSNDLFPVRRVYNIDRIQNTRPSTFSRNLGRLRSGTIIGHGTRSPFYIGRVDGPQSAIGLSYTAIHPR